MAYTGFKDLPRRTASDRVLRDKAFNIAKTPKHDGYQRDLSSMVYKFFHKKTPGSNTSGGAVKSEVVQSKELAEELNKPIIRTFEKQIMHSSFRDNIWGADLADMQLISKLN